MKNAVPLVEIWRGPLAESVHVGHAVICGPGGVVHEAWGNPETPVLPRSSAKMIQALPLLESGAAAAHGLGPEQFALACASHSGAEAHISRVTAWMTDLGLTDDDFRCGAHLPDGAAEREAMLRANETPCQVHNVCSGKHAGFLTLARHLGAGPEYVEIDHPVQQACLAAFNEVTGETLPGYGIDGCSAPNHVCTLHGMARAMAAFASATGGADARQTAMVRLREAMMAHPDLVAGEARACTELMRACTEPVALKTGAEGFYIAIIPDRQIGIALKITDGATRASECVIAALLVRLGVLEAGHPATRKVMNAPQRNHRGLVTGVIRPAATLLS